MKYELAYCYDVPHSASFIIDAKNKKEALRKARQLLLNGEFDGLKGDPDDTGYRERVYIGDRISEEQAAPWEAL